MFGRWFKRSNRLEHADADVRLTALTELSGDALADAQAKLLAMAQGDPDLKVRRTALQLLQAPDDIATLLDDPELQTDAAQQIWSTISGSEPRQSDQHQYACHPQVLRVRIEAAREDDVASLVPDLEDPAQLAELALRFKDDLRQHILQAAPLMTETGLAVLERTTRSRDKTCNRYARDQLELIRGAKAECTQALSRLEEIDEAITRELKHEAADIASRIVQHDKLKMLAKRRAQNTEALQGAATTLAPFGVQTAPVPPDPLAQFDWEIEQPQDPFAELASELVALKARIEAQAAPSSLEAERNSLAERWLSLADLTPPSAAQHKLFEQTTHEFLTYRKRHAYLDEFDWASLDAPQRSDAEANLLRDIDSHKAWQRRYTKFIKTLDWPAEISPPEQITALATRADTVAAVVKELVEQREALQQEQAQLLELIDAAIDQGQTQQALKHMRRARTLQKIGLTGENKKLNVLSARLKELEDWQHFATDPKREDLLKQMQTIADEPLDPPAQLKQVKAIREQWRDLGPIRGAHDAQLREQFELSAEAAFGHCRAHLDEQARLRADNLAQREALCVHLADYLAQTDWASADMNAAEQIMRTARTEWHRFHPCDRKQLKPVEARFEALQQQLHDQVKSAWDANIEQKKALIEQARDLLEGPIDEQVNGAKALQARWRQVGPIPRGVDQRLWREFRNLCDQVFTNRDTARQAADEQWQALNQRIDKELDAVSAALAAAQEFNPGMLRDWRAQIESVADGTRLSAVQAKRLRQIEETFSHKLEADRKRGLEEEVTQFKAWDIEVSQAEHQPGGDDASTPPHPVFAARLAGNATAESWLRLTLEAEIAADIASPAQDQGERMALQVELMNQGIRQDNVTSYKELMLRWCAAGPKDAAADALRDRFFAAIAQRL